MNKMQQRPTAIMHMGNFDARNFRQAKHDETIDIDIVDGDKAPDSMATLRDALGRAISAAVDALGALPEPERKSKLLTDDPRHQEFLRREARFAARMAEEKEERQRWLESRTPPMNVISRVV